MIGRTPPAPRPQQPQATTFGPNDPRWPTAGRAAPQPRPQQPPPWASPNVPWLPNDAPNPWYDPNSGQPNQPQPQPQQPQQPNPTGGQPSQPTTPPTLPNANTGGGGMIGDDRPHGGGPVPPGSGSPQPTIPFPYTGQPMPPLAVPQDVLNSLPTWYRDLLIQNNRVAPGPGQNPQPQPGVGGAHINTSITPGGIYSPLQTRAATNQAIAAQHAMADPYTQLKQFDRPGSSRSSANAALAMPGIQAGRLGAAQASFEIPFRDAQANLQHLLAGETAREGEALDWGSILARMMEQQSRLRTSQLGQGVGILDFLLG